jgi:hypothetical protein
MKAQKECAHAELVFGSGDYYLFCRDCGATWGMLGDFNEPTAQRLAPELANQGAGSSLSGVCRVAPGR